MQRRQKRVLQKVFLVISIPTVSLCATFILLYIFVPPRYDSPITPPQPVSVAPRIVHDTTVPLILVAAPVQLSIDRVAIDAMVHPVGMNANGDMDIDDNPLQLAWYKLGPKPGEEGSAVIAGHYGWKNGIPSAFNDINKLVPGDEISSISEDGEVKTFIVSRTAIYAPDQDATNVFRSDDGKAHLNLITCQGSWNNTAQTYSERLVVFTDLRVN